MVELAPEIIALLCLAAVAAGFVDAIAGGGGLITVPALLAAGVPPVAAIATNKVQASFGTASATWSYWRAGRIDFGILKWPLAATLVGAGLGAFAVTVVDTRWLMVLLPVLLIAIALYFLFGPKASDEDAHARLTPLAYSAVAGGIGFYDGFFGPGTGSFFALSLVTLMGMGLTRATAHTKALNLMSNVISVVVLAAGGHVLWLLGGSMAVGQIIGGRLGAHSAMRFGPRLIRPLLVVISLGMVAKLLSDPANPLRIMVAGWFG
ncbi:putative membrane protein YfcA [Brevundimonas nasdae]|uniref:TSUP family transporter n=1 Tax=Brevundimonas nasdae TaxID=172043 RepID=UPI0019136559|nr:TSUP family transporter [Brevundimonas nasdae]MBK6024989.1 TSUP family transporter [Brevundimonas nasdae]MDQ0451677.1 putative membrane protein YfcA [Brevundimonas nasdae]